SAQSAEILGTPPERGHSCPQQLPSTQQDRNVRELYFRSTLLRTRMSALRFGSGSAGLRTGAPYLRRHPPAIRGIASRRPSLRCKGDKVIERWFAQNAGSETPAPAAESGVGSVEGDRDAFALPLETLDAMFEPGRKDQRLTGGRRHGNTDPRTDPGELDPGSFIHSDGRAARIAEVNLTTLHLGRHLDVVSGGQETSRVRMECVEVAGPVHIEPAAEPELVFLLARLWPEVIEESLDVLLHLVAKFLDDRLLQL